MRQFIVAAVRPGAGWRVGLLAACMCGLLLVGARPLGAQAPQKLPMVGVHGRFLNQEVHQQGTYDLQKRGTTVQATFSSQRSAVQFAARQEPAVLFTVPEGFRPSQAVTREVEGWPVTADAVLVAEVVVPTRFQVQVAPSGEVRYLDDARLDEVDYLAYQLTTFWATPEVRAAFDDPQAHRQGTYMLRRTGARVVGTFTTTRSPVQHYARPRPEILFTVPSGFRPAERVRVRVLQPQPVDRAGAPLVTRRAPPTFQIQVDPDGRVRYVDGVSLDNVGYLGYQVKVAWKTAAPALPGLGPTPADSAGLCGRHSAVQAAVRAQLATAAGAQPACAAVTRSALAGLAGLHLELGMRDAPLRRQDLAGLNGLTELTLRGPDVLFRWWPADLLAEVPDLQALDLDLFGIPTAHLPSAEQWQTEPLLALLRPHVQFRGSLGSPHNIDPFLRASSMAGAWLAALLAQVPQLQRLQVRGQFRTLPADLLAHNVLLRRLTVRSPVLGQVSAGLLAPVPELQQFSLESPGVPSIPEGLLMHSAQLQKLSLTFGEIPKYYPSFEVRLPAGLLSHNPKLRELILRIQALRTVPADLLMFTPQLEQLKLVGLKLDSLPLNFWAQTPQLQQLFVCSWRLTELAGRMLAYTPKLERLTLLLPQLTTPTEELLAHMPQIQQLWINNDLLVNELKDEELNRAHHSTLACYYTEGSKYYE